MAFFSTRAMARGAGIAMILGASLARGAQPEPDTRGHDADTDAAQREIFPPVRLGLRLLAAWRQLPVEPTLVIVPDTESYLSALERWELGAMFPILIDDGSDTARENIARFVRAYAPDHVLRWRAGTQGATDKAAPTDRVDAMIAHAWGADAPEALDERWRALTFEPPGVVVASASDPAWPGAAALAAGHGQHIIWTTVPARGTRGKLESPDLEALDRTIIGALESQAWPWKDLGDAIESVTLCLNIPSRIDAPPGGQGDYALTDRIGRHPDGRRYAWCGIAFGDASDSAYRAMCALFLAPDHGWIFDGYDQGYPAQYSAALALDLFKRRDFSVTFTEASGATLDAWRARSRGGIDGGWVDVNSAGHATWFQLAHKDRAYASETPLLRQPAAVHFIHSFSAQFADGPSTISGRWLENGAYAYIGAVHEPGLGAFLPPEKYFSRLFAGAPFGAAGRFDDAPQWKVQVIGDPLIIAAPPRPRRDAQPDLEGARPLDDLMKEALQDRRFADAIAMLVELNRDEDALRLTRSALDQADDADKAGIARGAINAAFRAGDQDLFITLYGLLPPRQAADDLHRSMLWQLLRDRVVGADPDAKALALLRRNIRDESAVEDAADIRHAVSALYGTESVRAMYQELIDRIRNERTKQQLRDAMGG